MKCRVVKKCIYQSKIYDVGSIIEVDKHSFDFIKLSMRKSIEKYIPEVVKEEEKIEPVKKRGKKK